MADDCETLLWFVYVSYIFLHLSFEHHNFQQPISLFPEVHYHFIIFILLSSVTISLLFSWQQIVITVYVFIYRHIVPWKLLRVNLLRKFVVFAGAIPIIHCVICRNTIYHVSQQNFLSEYEKVKVGNGIFLFGSLCSHR